MRGAQYLLDVDRAASAFRLLFSFVRDDGSEAEDQPELAQVLRELLRGLPLPKGAQAKLEPIFETEMTEPSPLHEVADQVARDFARDRSVLLSLVSLLLRVTSDDGLISRSHREQLKVVLDTFEVTMQDFESFDGEEQQLIILILTGQNRLGTDSDPTLGRSLAQHYQLLGCRPDVSEPELRRIYRALVMKFHPDRRAALNASKGEGARPEEEEREWNRKFQAIQLAYEAICKSRQ